MTTKNNKITTEGYDLYVLIIIDNHIVYKNLARAFISIEDAKKAASKYGGVDTIIQKIHIDIPTYGKTPTYMGF